MKRIVTLLSFVDRAFAAAVNAMLIAVLVAMVLLVASQVVLRNFFGSGIDWGDVAARHMVLWVAFLGAMLATRSRQHINIDMLTRFIPNTPKNAVLIALDAFSCAICVMLAKASLAFAIGERELGGELFLGIPAWAVQMIMPFGFAMMAIEYAIGIGLDIYRICIGTAGHVAGKGRGC